MYITSLNISRIRSVTNFRYEMKLADCPGWHVILGDNGSGKSSIIRSLALIFAGGPKISAARQIWEDWISEGADTAEIEAQINRTEPSDQYIQKGKQPSSFRMRATIERNAPTSPTSASISFGTQNQKTAERTIWAPATGWFSASFGPFRRFSGGDRDWDRLFVSPEYRRIAAHLSAFGEDVAFSEALYWLQQLRVNSLEDPSRENQAILDAVVSFMNASQLLPHGATIAEITSKQVRLTDASKATVSVEQMSDGYRSVLSLTFELLRQMFLAFGNEVMLKALNSTPGKIALPGVVAIDEIDAHLHPTWQTRIGDWFVEHFPNIQFFTTTHSPLICRAAIRGSIWRLPTPGTQGCAVRVTGQELDRLIRGNILDAYGTDFFGKDIDTPASVKLSEEKIAHLSMLEAQGRLEPAQAEELQSLRSAHPTAASKFEK